MERVETVSDGLRSLIAGVILGGLVWVPVGIWIADSFVQAGMFPIGFFTGGIAVTGFVRFMRRFDPTEPPDPHA
jgi:hypothetical protein